MTGEALFRKIDCIRLYVPDLEAGLEFYSGRLGHSLIWRSQEAAGLRMPGTDAELVLENERPGTEIDIKVDSADQAARRFEDAGGKLIAGPFDIQIGKAAVVQDPWGNTLILLDASKGLLLTDSEGNITGNAPVSLIDSEVDIRLAGEEDLPELRRLYNEFHEYHGHRLPGRLRSLKGKEEEDRPRLDNAIREVFSNPDAVIYMANVSGRAAGLVEVYLRQVSEDNPLVMPCRYGYIQSVMVSEAYRGLGSGRRLVEAAQQWASQKGASEMRLDIWEFEGNALGFYEKLGYHTLKREMATRLE